MSKAVKLLQDLRAEHGGHAFVAADTAAAGLYYVQHAASHCPELANELVDFIAGIVRNVGALGNLTQDQFDAVVARASDIFDAAKEEARQAATAEDMAHAIAQRASMKPEELN